MLPFLFIFVYLVYNKNVKVAEGEVYAVSASVMLFDL